MLRREVHELFGLLDMASALPEPFARGVLHSILTLEPCCSRAQALLDELDGYEPVGDRQLMSDIEKAEACAALGHWSGARAMAAWVRSRHGDHPLARTWLEGAHLLWDC